MNAFSERYKSFSDAELLTVLQNPAKYQPEALEAAKEEAVRRNLSGEALEAAQNEIAEQKQRESDKRTKVKEQVKRYRKSVLDPMDPSQPALSSAEKQVRYFTLAFILFALSHVNNAWFLISIPFEEWSLLVLEYLLPPILWIMGTLLFWKKKKAGWSILAGLLMYSLLSTLIVAVFSWTRPTPEYPAFNITLDSPSPLSTLLVALLYGVTLWRLAKRDITELYQLNRMAVFFTLVIGGGIAVSITTFTLIL